MRVTPMSDNLESVGMDAKSSRRARMFSTDAIIVGEMFAVPSGASYGVVYCTSRTG
jgi:hypothetical protein